MPEPRFDWTDERIATMRDMADLGYSGTEIAKAIGAPSRQSVIGKAHSLGVRLRGAAVQRRAARTVANAIVDTPAHPIEALAPDAVTLFDARPMQCRFPLWPTNGQTPHYTQAFVCGEPVAVPGVAYCQRCMDRVFTPRTSKRKAAKPASRVPGKADQAFGVTM